VEGAERAAEDKRQDAAADRQAGAPDRKGVAEDPNWGVDSAGEEVRRGYEGTFGTRTQSVVGAQDPPKPPLVMSDDFHTHSLQAQGGPGRTARTSYRMRGEEARPEERMTRVRRGNGAGWEAVVGVGTLLTASEWVPFLWPMQVSGRGRGVRIAMTKNGGGLAGPGQPGEL
jgi:hypothetical protein